MTFLKKRILAILPLSVMFLFALFVLFDRDQSRFGSHVVGIGRVAIDLENGWYDFKTKHLAARTQAPVTVAAIDDASIQRFGRWPWSRGVFSEITELLYDSGAKSVVFDVVFSEPEYQSRDLEKILQVPIPGRKGSLIDVLKLSKNQVLELSRTLPDIGDQYLGQMIWRHSSNTVLGYFWQNESECRVLPDSAMPNHESDHLGFISESTWTNQIELIKKYGFRVSSSSQFLNQKFFKNTLSNMMFCATLNRGAVGSLSQWQGFFNAEPEADGIFRKSKLFLPFVYDGNRYGNPDLDGYYLFPSLSLAVLMSSSFPNALPEVTWRQFSALQMRSINFSNKNFSIETLSDASVLIDFSKRGETDHLIPTISLSRAGVWSDQENKLIKDKVVMIGPTSAGVYDLRPNPVDNRGAGVYLHAATASQLLEMAQDPTYKGPRYLKFIGNAAFLLALMMGIFVSVFFMNRMTYIYASLAFFTIALAYDFYIFRNGHVSDIVVIVLSSFLALILVNIVLYFKEQKERMFLKNAFARYVSPEIVRRIEESPSELMLKGQRKDLTIMFCDLRGFTRLSENLDPEKIMELLKSCFEPMTQSILSHNGTVDKFIGDAIMALFGAPLENKQHSTCGFRSAIEIIESLNQMNRTDPEFSKHQLSVGISLAAGIASVGNMGTDKIFNYTALGDVVNVSSRLEGLTKEYGVPLLIAESVFEELSPEDKNKLRFIDMIRVSGRSKSLKIYDCPSLVSREASEPEHRAQFISAYEAYLSQDWTKALALFDRLSANDPVCRTLARRCELAPRIIQKTDWDGVWNFEHK